MGTGTGLPYPGNTVPFSTVLRVCAGMPYRHFGQVSDHLTSLIHSRRLSVSTTPPPSLAPNASWRVLLSFYGHRYPFPRFKRELRGLFFVLCDYGLWYPLPRLKRESRGLFFRSMRLRPPVTPPRFKRESRGIFLRSTRLRPLVPPPSLQTQVEGSLLPFYMTTASGDPSLASNASRGVSSFVLRDYGQCYPLPRSKREQRGLHPG